MTSSTSLSLARLFILAATVVLPNSSYGQTSPRDPGLANEQKLADVERLQREIDILQKRGDFRAMLPLAERLLDLRKTALEPNDRLVDDAVNNLATVHLAVGNYKRAEELLQNALAIQSKRFGHYTYASAMTLNNLAGLYIEMGDFVRAEPLINESLRVLQEVPVDPSVASPLGMLGRLYSARGDYLNAHQALREALTLCVQASRVGQFAPYLEHVALRPRTALVAVADPRAFGIGPLDVADALDDLALLYEHGANYDLAEKMFTDAMRLRGREFASDHPFHLNSLTGLGLVYRDTRDYVRAEVVLKRAIDISDEKLGLEHPDVGKILNALGSLYVAKGDYSRAEPLFERALAVQEKVFGAYHGIVATSLLNLAGLYRLRNDAERAERVESRALSIQEEAFGKKHPDVALSLMAVSLHYEAKGDDAGAMRLLLRAQKIAEDSLSVRHPLVAQILSRMAFLHIRNGKYEMAERLLQSALVVQTESLGDGHPMVAETLDGLVLVNLGQSRIEEAIVAAKKATEIQDNTIASAIAVGSEDQKRLYMNRLASQTANNLSLHVQYAPHNQDAAHLALTSLLRRKGRVLDAMTDALGALRRSADAKDYALLNELTIVYGQIATLSSRGLASMTPEEYRHDLARLERRREELESKIGIRGLHFGDDPKLVSLQEVQAKIHAMAALVEIARYEPLHLRGNAAQSPRYVAYVVRQQGEPMFVDLGEAARIESAIDAFRAALSDHDLTHDPKPAARTLDHLLMEPIRKLLGDARWVFLSPDGPLHLVPFGALVDTHGEYLVQSYLFTYLTTGRDLLHFGSPNANTLDAPLVLANPAFDEKGESTLPESTHRGLRSIDMITHPLPLLTNTTDEARAIARLFPQSRVLLGDKATEAAVKSAHAPWILHLATHGFFLPERSIPKALLLSSDNPISSVERAALLQRENPLLRSGVALAGFNQRQSGDDDGVLTALEAAGLDLDGTKLVVLSTCESGLGQATTGEGVYGLRRAFAIAGAETQVMSLWQVDTGRTRELMQAYYGRLQQGEGRSEAMRDVQLAMLMNSETQHPNLWASFIVSGEWRTLEGQPRFPEVKPVYPGRRGCACAYVGGNDPSNNPGWYLLVVLAACLKRFRRSP